MHRRILIPAAPLAACVLALHAPVAAEAHVVSAAPATAAKTVKYKNCAALNKAYPHGVGRKGAKDKVTGKSAPVRNFTVNTKLYNAQPRSLDRDRDRDGIACEKR